MAATLCFAMLAAGLSAARCAAAAFPTAPTAVAAAAKLPLNVVLAQVPWKRSSRHPVPEFVPLATLPWANCHVAALYMPYRPEKTKKWVDPDYNFIMAMCRDKQGNLWLATEGSGIYRYDPSASKGKHWTQFTKQNTHGALANNCIYAIACDNHNRIWAGELNHGISVFNGKQWQDYDIVQNPKHNVLAGPLGNHVYAMKFDRYTDQMWIGTNAGISVYQCSGPRVGAIRHHWHYITQANGLPMNPDAIAFGKGGIIYVGTQCGGLAVGTPRSNGSGSRGKANGAHPTLITASAGNALGWSHYQWTVIKGPWHMPLSATGKGLPSNLINAVAVESGGRVVVGTDGGIAFGPSTSDASPAASAVPSPASLLAAPRRSANNLRHSMQRAPRWASHWTFEHGRNFVAKVHGLWHPPVHWQAPSGPVLEQLPTEDHTTVAAWQPNLGQGARAGYLWLGHWRAGLDVWQYNADGKIIQRWHIHEPQVGNYVESLQPLKGNAMAVGTYGRGAFIITLPGESKNAWRRPPLPTGAAAGNNRNNHSDNTGTGTLAYAPEPRAARPPSVHELTAMANAIREELINSSGQKQPRIVPLPDDWRTEGNWLGRYGKYYVSLPAVWYRNPDGTYGLLWGYGAATAPMWAQDFLTPALDCMRRWTCSLSAYRRSSLEVPPAFAEEQVASGDPRFGDPPRRGAEYDDHGEVYPTAMQGPGLAVAVVVPRGRMILSVYEFNNDAHVGTADRGRDYAVSVRVGSAWPPAGNPYTRSFSAFGRDTGVISRIAEFAGGGVWKRFLVRGPAHIVIHLHRNHSLNTLVNAVALDWTAERPPPYFCGIAGWRRRQASTRRAASMELQALRAGIPPVVAGADGLPGAACQALLSLARLQRRTEPMDWAASQAFVYSLAARQLQASGRNTPRGLPMLAACNYRLCQFRDWEHDLALEGLPVPRELEAMTKWKGHLRVFRDGGYRQLARNAARQWARTLLATK